jgi:hypothetical protein
MNYLAATIQGQTFHYEGPLTFDQVYTYRHTVCMWSCNPTYLFLTEEGALDLAREATGIENTSREASEQKAEVTPLRALFGMHIIILLTLPANTLIIGKFELNERSPLTRNQIEAVSEQAMQRMKEKHINLDWDEA